MCGILILVDIRPVRFHAVVVFGQGKNLLFKSILERCEPPQLRRACAVVVTRIAVTYR